jgi:hypothetical protein
VADEAAEAALPVAELAVLPADERLAATELWMTDASEERLAAAELKLAAAEPVAVPAAEVREPISEVALPKALVASEAMLVARDSTPLRRELMAEPWAATVVPKAATMKVEKRILMCVVDGVSEEVSMCCIWERLKSTSAVCLTVKMKKECWKVTRSGGLLIKESFKAKDQTREGANAPAIQGEAHHRQTGCDVVYYTGARVNASPQAVPIGSATALLSFKAAIRFQISAN